MPADDNRFILSGSSLLKNISGDVLLMAELYRHTRYVEAGLFQGRACVREHLPADEAAPTSPVRRLGMGASLDPARGGCPESERADLPGSAACLR